MANLALVKAVRASENSRFYDGTVLLSNLAGRMPVYVKADNTKSSVFPVHPVVAANSGIEAGNTYVVFFAKSETPVTYTRNNGEEVTERQWQIKSAQLVESALDIVKVTNELGDAINFGIQGDDTIDPAVEATKEAEKPTVI